jgi:hypothetical protein
MLKGTVSSEMCVGVDEIFIKRNERTEITEEDTKVKN